MVGNDGKDFTVCPVGCRYCMAAYVSRRADFWNKGIRLGINKSCVFVNRLPSDPPLISMDFPFHLMDGEFVGFQGITDCFWDVYLDDLKYMVKKVATSGIRKLTLISKIPASDEQIAILSDIKDKLTVCYSVTGLDAYENTTTRSRIRSLERFRNLGFDAFPVMHPYIRGISDYKSVIDALVSSGFCEMNWKGFRYDLRMERMPFLPYPTDGSEVMFDEDEISSYAEKKGISFVSLRERLHRTKLKGISKEKAEQQVKEFCKQDIVFSSSDTKENVIAESIRRRTC